MSTSTHSNTHSGTPTVTSSSQIAQTFLDFYRDRGHRSVVGTGLIPPPGDPVLFTTSGMHPLTPYFDGRNPYPGGRRLMNLQRCLRTTDLDEVGDSSHLTVFQMLGTWSLGDYDGVQSIRWGLELLRDGLGIDPSLLYVTVFGGDGQVGPDLESQRTWEHLGVPVELTREDNWWSNGPVGPCGPDTEIFYWTGNEPPTGTPTTDPRWVEIWNHVMMRYQRHDDGRLEPLRQRNIDTGMGLERLVMGLGGKSSVYETDLLSDWVEQLGTLWNLEGPDDPDLRLVSDHLRSSVVVVGDGVRRSNTRRGYVLRRLLRRTLTTLWRTDLSRTLDEVPDSLVESTLHQFDLTHAPGGMGGLGGGGDIVLWREVVDLEELGFRKLLDRGRRLVDKQLSRGPLTGDDLNYLHQTHGLPKDLVTGLLTDLVTGRP